MYFDKNFANMISKIFTQILYCTFGYMLRRSNPMHDARCTWSLKLWIYSCTLYLKCQLDYKTSEGGWCHPLRYKLGNMQEDIHKKARFILWIACKCPYCQIIQVKASAGNKCFGMAPTSRVKGFREKIRKPSKSWGCSVAGVEQLMHLRDYSFLALPRYTPYALIPVFDC